MRNLDDKIGEWRSQMAAGGIKSPAVLDELESHLREEILCRTKAGRSEEQAFREALDRMGNADCLRKEFSKVDSNRRILTGSFLVWLGMTGCIVVMLGERFLNGNTGLLLTVHIFSITTGYLSAFMAGGFAAAYVCAQSVDGTSATLKHQLAVGAIRFLDLATALVIVGFVLALFWTDRHYGRYWTKTIREIGGLTALAGLVVLSVVRRLGRLTKERQALLGLGASLVVGIAWYGMLLVEQNRPLGSWWPMEVFAAVHVFFFVLNFARRRKSIIQ